MKRILLVLALASCFSCGDLNKENNESQKEKASTELGKSEYYKSFRPTRVESKVPEYQLPELVTCLDGTKVSKKEIWQDKRRPEIQNLFEEHVYGNAPDKPESMTFKVNSIDENALNGLAIKKEITVSFFGSEESPSMDILVYLPKQIQKPVPLFFGLNFGGNHAIHSDTSISLCRSWIPIWLGPDENNKATNKNRGSRSMKWDIDQILKRGYGLATVYMGDIDPDKVDFSDGIQSHYYASGQSMPDVNEWGSIAAWSWGLSRGLDYFETDNDIDHNKVIVMGHSRLGKTALWAGACDERFAMVISNNSGCGGAALSRRAVGETVGKISHTFPHWFCGNFSKYDRKEKELPVDQHMLIAMVAPRPVYIASAQEDIWADPHGEFLSAKYAQEVYQLFGYTENLLTEWPDINNPVVGRIGYHVRSGKHDVLPYDWDAYIKFADLHLNNH